MLTSVTFQPGRLRLLTRPTATGSLLLANAMGMVLVAALAARGASRREIETRLHSDKGAIIGDGDTMVLPDMAGSASAPRTLRRPTLRLKELAARRHLASRRGGP